MRIRYASHSLQHQHPKYRSDEAVDMKERIERLYKIFNGNPRKFHVNGDTILNRRGYRVPGSSLKSSIRFIINEQRGLTERGGGRRRGKLLSPPGTLYVKEIIKNDPILKSFANPRDGGIKLFSPKLWQ